MTDRELKKLSRGDLLQMLLEQSREVQALKERLAAAERALEDRSIRLEKAGSIAEAALQLNGVFEAAQVACRQYVENITRISGQQEQLSRQIEQDSRIRAAQLIADAERQCAALRRETEAECADMLEQAKEQSRDYWNAVFRRVDELSVHGDRSAMAEPAMTDTEQDGTYAGEK